MFPVEFRSSFPRFGVGIDSDKLLRLIDKERG